MGAIRRLKHVLQLLLLGGVSLWAGFAQAEAPVSLIPGMVYTQAETRDGSKRLRLDLYMPRNGCTGGCPVVVGVHGGGFVAGDRKTPFGVTMAKAAAQAGFAAILIDYRLVEDLPELSKDTQTALADEIGRAKARIVQRVPRGRRAVAALAAMEDVAASLDWITAQSDRYGLRADKVAVFGLSAGASVALNLTYGAEEMGVPLAMPIAGVVDYQGRLFDGFELAAGDPPVMVAHGTADDRVEFNDAVAIHEAAKAAEVPVWYVPLADVGHGFEAMHPGRTIVEGETLLGMTLTFFDQVLGTPGELTSRCVTNRADLCD